MNTIADELYTFNWEIKKSKFLTIIGKITNKTELHKFLEKHQDLQATHNCYAYKFGIEQVNGGYHDDGEPSGSAGLPIFKVIENNHLTNIIILVIRYFGGIKLGQGPLTRAYGQSASRCLKDVPVQQIEKVWQTTISFEINQIKKVDYYCLKHHLKIIQKDFKQNVQYIVESEAELKPNILFKIISKKAFFQ